MGRGATISALMHAALLLVVLLDGFWAAEPSGGELAVANVTIIDAGAFGAQLSGAPVAPREVPDAPDPGVGTTTDERPPTPGEVAETRPAPEAAPPAPQPETPPEDVPVLDTPPPPTTVPTEVARPSIAEVPVPEAAPAEAPVPESPPATEPLQPLASAEAPPADRPARPPDPEPEPAEAPEPEPDPAEADEASELAEEAAQPDAPSDAAPQVATLPVARPAEEAAASQASRETAQAEPEPEAAPETETETEAEAASGAAPGEEARPGRAGTVSRFARQMTRGEKDALALGIEQHFVYNGPRYQDLQVKLRIGLDFSGRIVEGPDLVSAEGSNRAARQRLVRDGRNALIKAQNAGEFSRLPIAKYDLWKYIHVTFTPEEIGFSS